MIPPVYLDYAATTPVDPRVAQVMAQYLTGEGIFGNPSSASHAYGREAAQHLEAARADVAALIGAAEPSGQNAMIAGMVAQLDAKLEEIIK